MIFRKPFFFISLFAIMLLKSPALIAEEKLDLELFAKCDFVEFIFVNGEYKSVLYQLSNSIYSKKQSPIPSEITSNIFTSPIPQQTGIWFWEYKRIFGHEGEIIEKLVKHKINRVYLQIDLHYIDSYAPFLREAKKNNILVYALDGDPGYVKDFQPIINDIKAVLKFNAENSDAGFAGFQSDVEPYILKDFSINKNRYIENYLRLLSTMKAAAEGRIKISATIPYWFDEIPFYGKALTDRIIDIVDELVLMSYKTDYNTVINISMHKMRYGTAAGKPVFIGLELTNLPDEEHFVILKRDLTPFANQRMSLPEMSKKLGFQIPVTERYRVLAKNITLYHNMNTLKDITSRRPDINGFGGYVLHSYEALDDWVWPEEQ